MYRLKHAHPDLLFIRLYLCENRYFMQSCLFNIITIYPYYIYISHLGPYLVVEIFVFKSTNSLLIVNVLRISSLKSRPKKLHSRELNGNIFFYHSKNTRARNGQKKFENAKSLGWTT